MGPASHTLVPLLPSRAREIGWALLCAGAAFAFFVLRLGKRPAALDVRIFALYSAFFEKRSFAWIEKNLSIELTICVVLLGLFCVLFARERQETELTSALRVRALVGALFVNTALLCASLFTVFGLGFVYVLVVNLFSTFALAAVWFRYSVWRARRRSPGGGGA